MIEGIMIFALGVLAASLIGLLVIPALSRRAARRATADLMRRMPMTMAEIKGQRDQLRAGHAIDLRRLEEAHASTQARLAAAMSESGRHVTRIVAVEGEAAAAHQTVARLTAELAASTRAMHEAEGTLGTQVMVLHDALGLATLRGDRLAAAEARLATAEWLADERRALIASLETRLTGDDLRLRDVLSRAARLAEELAAARTALDDSIGERDIAKADGLLAAKTRDALKARVDALASALAGLEAERDAARQATARAEQRMRLQSATVDGLTDRVIAQDAERDTLHRRLDEAQIRRAAAPSADPAPPLAEDDATVPDGPPFDPEAGSATPEERAAALRLAVARLAADLVAFATDTGAASPADTTGEHAPAA